MTHTTHTSSTDPEGPASTEDSAGIPAPPQGPAAAAILGSRLVIGVGIAVVVVSTVLRFVTRSDLWLDEALTVNIAKLPLGDLREALRHDGAPPLYYVLLHGWIDLFGTSDVAVRALSGVLSVATLPLAWFAGRRLGRTGPPGPVCDDPPEVRLVAALVVVILAASPFAIRYATEARMYSLVMLLVTGGYLSLRRAAERPTLGRLAVVALVVAALLYTQYWCIYLLVVVGVGVLWRAVRAPTADARHAARGIVVAMVAGVIVFAPWVDTFLYQNGHTGTPWGDGRVPWSAAAQAFDQFAGGTSVTHGESAVAVVLLLLLVPLALFGRAAGPRHVDIDVRTRPAVRTEALVAGAALLLGLVVAFVTDGAFDGRYASMVYPLLVLVVAWAFTAFAARAVLLGVLAVLIGFSWAGAVRNVIDDRTQAGQVADVILARARPGDVVVYCADQLGPAVSRLLGDRDLVQLTFPRGDPPELVDWVDYIDRINRTDPTAFGRRVLDEANGHTIWYVAATRYNIEGKCEAVGATIGAERRGAVAHVTPDEDTFFEPDGLIEYPSS